LQLEKAKVIAENTRRSLASWCHRIEVAGSIRRGKYDVHDVDIVCIPISQAFYTVLNRLGNVSGGPRIYKVELREFTDRQMADLVMEANIVRQDLTPIDLAHFFQKYMEDFKVSETELATLHHCSQGHIANTLRLLQLPEAITAQVISQEIPEAHARQLLRLNDQPERQKKFAAIVAKEKPTVTQLDTEINRDLWDSSNELSKRQYGGPRFDLKACEDCKDAVMVANPWGDRKKELRCVNRDCYEKKQKAAVAAAAKREAATIAKKVGTAKVLTSKDISYDKYATLKGKYSGNYKHDLANPEECDKCKHKALYAGRDADPTDLETICTNPSCYRGKKSAKTRAVHKDEKAQELSLTEKLAKDVQKFKKNRHGALVVAAKMLMAGLRASGDFMVCKMLPDLPKTANGRLDDEKTKDLLPAMTEDELVPLVFALVLSRRRSESFSDQYSTELKGDAKLDYSTLDGSYKQLATEQIQWQKDNCTGCKNAKLALVETTSDCCGHAYSYKKLREDGRCENSPAIKATEVKDEGKPKGKGAKAPEACQQAS